MKEKTYYCDMDGVLANFFKEKDCLERFKNEMGFFARLEPIKENLEGLKTLIQDKKKVKIITTSPNIRADRDKKKWLAKYLPEIQTKNIIICRPSQRKIDFVAKRLRKNAVLIDDYGKNIKEWVDNGGKYSIKITEKEPAKTEIKVYHCKNIKNYLEMVSI